MAFDPISIFLAALLGPEYHHALERDSKRTIALAAVLDRLGFTDDADPDETASWTRAAFAERYADADGLIPLGDVMLLVTHLHADQIAPEWRELHSLYCMMLYRSVPNEDMLGPLTDLLRNIGLDPQEMLFNEDGTPAELPPHLKAQ
jgi:hypothetical protein